MDKSPLYRDYCEALDKDIRELEYDIKQSKGMIFTLILIGTISGVFNIYIGVFFILWSGVSFVQRMDDQRMLSAVKAYDEKLKPMCVELIQFNVPESIVNKSKQQGPAAGTR